MSPVLVLGLRARHIVNTRSYIDVHGSPTASRSLLSQGFAHRKVETLQRGKRTHSHIKRRAGLGGGEQTTIAFGLAVLSSFFNGSFPACSRIPAVPTDPVLFNGLVCLGVFLSSLPIPLGAATDYVFTPGGAAGGFLLVFAFLFSFLAIPRCGLATAQAVWSTSAILVSFSWGAFGPAEVAAKVKDLPLSLAALFLMVLSALVIVSCEAIAQSLSGEQPASASEEESDAPSESDRPAGLASALAVGIFGGSVLVPLKFVPQDVAGLSAMPSFGLGALLAGALVTLGYWFLVRREEKLPNVPGDVLLAGIASGLIWNMGNVCSIIAQSPPYSLAYGIAYPILQCALFFGGLWGIYAFGEIRGNAVGVFWAGATGLTAGIVGLSLYGPGAA